MTKTVKSRVVVRSTGCRVPREGWWRRYDDLAAAEKARPRRDPKRDVHFTRGATFPPDPSRRRKLYFRFVAAD